MHDRAEISDCLAADKSAADLDAVQRSPSTACPVCAGTSLSHLIEIPGAPVFCNVLWPTREAALAADTADMQLYACRDCDHVFNAAFRPDLMSYSAAYENSLHFSQHFSAYAKMLAKRLIETYGIHGKHVIDVGCGRGDFLSVLSEMGGNRGYGFDKSFAASESPAASGVTLINDFYSEIYADYPCDLLCCRHVLEHIEDPDEFLAGIRRALSGNVEAIVFFEVPNSAYTLRDLGIWDLIYEHCGYFNAGSLQHAFARNGFAVLGTEELYDGQFLGITCKRTAAETPKPVAQKASLRADIDSFADRYHAKMAYWQGVITELERAGKRVVLWGGGSKGVTFLNQLRPACVAAVVDVNPRKHGRYVPGTGQELISPAQLRELQPDAVIVMNAVYKDEIADCLSGMDLAPVILTA
jgi:SAM-dependent methyltransferase